MDDISRLRCDIFLINYSVGSFGTIRYYYITRGGVRILGGGGVTWFTGGMEGEQSLLTEYKGRTIENWLPFNCRWRRS